MKRICIVTTMWSSINNWIKPFLDEYNSNNIEVTIVCNMNEDFISKTKEEYPFVKLYHIAFPRGIRFLGSLRSINILYKFLKKEQFDMIQYSTPNASFYASISSKKAKVPIRLYCQWGMVYVAQKGLKRVIFKAMEKYICKNSTMIQPDSIGNLEFCRKQGFYNESNSCVIWNGSAKGIDLKIYDDTKKYEYSKEIKQKYSIKDDECVIGFVGRLGREKGCNELFSAFKKIKEKIPNCKLLFVGPIEKVETIDQQLLDYFWSCDDIIKTDRVSNVVKYIAAMDVFVLPSYREGFGMSVVEASAMKVPVVATKYPGPSSAMIDGVTGIAVNIKAVDELQEAIMRIIINDDMAARMGNSGREYAVNMFDHEVFKIKYMENRLLLLGIKK